MTGRAARPRSRHHRHVGCRQGDARAGAAPARAGRGARGVGHDEGAAPGRARRRPLLVHVGRGLRPAARRRRLPRVGRLPSGHRSGTLRSELDRIRDAGRAPLLELEPSGALAVKGRVPGAVTSSSRRPTSRSSSAGSASGRPRAQARSRSGSRSRGGSSSRPSSSTTWSSTTISSGPPRSSRRSSAGRSTAQLPCAPMIHPRIDELLRQRRLALRARHRRRQARAADQQLPPPARRGHVRGISAAARRVALEELLDDGPGGDRRGQDQVRSTRSRRLAAPAGRRHNVPMARVLVGVTGGIAAYKACELVRLLVKAGHDVVPLVTAGAERFVTARDLRRARPPRAERGPLPAPDARRPARGRAVTANTLAKLAHGLADNVAHRGGARAPRAARSSRRR